MSLLDTIVSCIITENGFGAHDLGIDALSLFSQDVKILFKLGLLLSGNAHKFICWRHLVVF